VGHAIEAASGYTATHGRAVAQGMRAAGRLAAAMGLCDEATVAAQDDLLEPFGLPGPLPPVTAEAVLAALPRDKKAAAGRARWVLPRELGRADVGVDAPPEVIERVVRDTIGR
jgi:3-dehydroquinate synthase